MGSFDLPHESPEQEAERLRKQAEEAEKPDTRTPQQIRESRRKTKRYLDRTEDETERLRKEAERKKIDEAHAAITADDFKQMGMDLLKQAGFMLLVSAIGTEGTLIPRNDVAAPKDMKAAMSAFELDKAYREGGYEWIAIKPGEEPERRDQYTKKLFEKVTRFIEGMKKSGSLPAVLRPEQKKLREDLMSGKLKPDAKDLEQLEDIAMKLGLIETRWDERRIMVQVNRETRLRNEAMRAIDENQMRTNWSWRYLEVGLAPEGLRPSKEEVQARQKEVINLMIEEGFEAAQASPSGTPEFDFVCGNKTGRMTIYPNGFIQYEAHDLAVTSLESQRRGREYDVHMVELISGRFKAENLRDGIRSLRADMNMEPRKRRALLDRLGPQYLYAQIPSHESPAQRPYALVSEPLRIPDNAIEGPYGIKQFGEAYPIVANFPMYGGWQLPGLETPHYSLRFFDMSANKGEHVPYMPRYYWMGERREAETGKDML